MLAQIYPISFLVALGALTGWFYFQKDDMKSGLYSKVFFLSLAVFVASWLLNEGTWEYKFMKLGREALILAVVPLFLSFFKTKKWVFLGLLFVVLGSMDYFYFDDLKATFIKEAAAPVEEKQVDYGYLDRNGELLVELQEGHAAADIQGALQKYGLTASPAFSPKDAAATDLDDYFLINIPDNEMDNFLAIKKELMDNGLVEWVEENETYALSPLETTPQKALPGMNKKYGLNDPGLSQLWGFEAMGVNDLYGVLSKNKPVQKTTIAILDTGVDAEHEDLKANFTSIQSKYDDDPRGHGTHCAGIAAAVSNNHKGVASFSQTNDYVQVTSVKVLSAGGFGTQKTIIDGILEAADAGADVLSLSLGGPSNDSRQRAYKKAVDYANKKGAIVVVAAGNSNRNAKGYSPANTPGVITVSAVDTLQNKASFSNTVNDLKMGVAAPGVKIYSTFPDNKYKTFNGTSMATPYVAGLLGLMKSFHPKLTTKEAFDILDKTGKPTAQSEQTGNLIQPAEAVKMLLGSM